MGIFRVKKQEKFSTISNTVANDKRLTFKAVGIHTYLLTKPDDWQVYQKELVKAHKDGRDSVSSGVQELIDCGYIKRVQDRDENGHFVGYSYDVYEEPQPIDDKQEKPTGNGKSVNGKSENGKPASTKDSSEPSTKGIYTPEFEIFWKSYERHGTKKAAAKKWNTLSAKARDEITTTYLPAYNEYCKAEEWYSRKYAEGWLNGEMWRKDWRKMIKAKKEETTTTSLSASKGVKSY